MQGVSEEHIRFARREEGALKKISTRTLLEAILRKVPLTVVCASGYRIWIAAFQELVVESAERQPVADCGVGRAGSPSRPVAGWQAGSRPAARRSRPTMAKSSLALCGRKIYVLSCKYQFNLCYLTRRREPES